MFKQPNKKKNQERESLDNLLMFLIVFQALNKKVCQMLNFKL